MKISRPYILITTFLVCLFYTNYSQKSQIKNIDSLKEIIQNPDSDSDLVNALKKWSDLIYLDDPLKEYELVNQIIEVCNENISSKKLSFKEILFFEKKLAFSYNIVGTFFKDRGNYDQALKFYNKAQYIYIKNNNEKQNAKMYMALGELYYIIDSVESSLRLFNKSLDIRRNIQDIIGIAKTYNAIAMTYNKLNKSDTALKLLHESARLKKNNKDSISLPSTYSNLGYIFQKLNNYDSAFIYYDIALKIDFKNSNKYGICNSFMNIGILKKQEKDYFKSKINLLKALEIANLNNYGPLKKKIAEELYQIFKTLNEMEKALSMHEIFKNASDSISKNSALKRIQENNFETERKIKKAELKTQKEIVKWEKTKNLYLILISILVGFFSLIFYRNYLVTKKQKKIIENQHDELNTSHNELEYTHKEIKDSINYAKKIQDALLTSHTYIKKVLPNSFVFYRPKDIVSGDFYWAYEIGNKIFFTVADCTGHGVPGALVSMIGNALLDENIKDKKNHNPADVLNKMRDKVAELLNEEGIEKENRDGMDIALCCFDKEKLILEYAGAFNPLIHISDGQINEYKADSQPVALYIKGAKPFTKHTIKLKKNDCIYIYTDGFQDQFGGERGKKYMSKKFKKFLCEISSDTIENQYQSIKTEFNNWKGDNEQIDDVCIMGVKF